MKKNPKPVFSKALSCLLVLVILASTMLLTACKSEPLVIKESDTYFVIKTNQEIMAGKENMMLIEYMDELAKKGELTCVIRDGMIVSINGIENPADFSSCWMLFTSDAENANTAWGVIEYEGKQYGSAISGAETLPIKADQLYIWVYQSFS